MDKVEVAHDEETQRLSRGIRAAKCICKHIFFIFEFRKNIKNILSDTKLKHTLQSVLTKSSLM